MAMYVWLDVENGTFSNSWSEEEYKKYEQDIKQQLEKLPNYRCLKVESVHSAHFEFNRMMKISTNKILTH